MMLWLLLNGRRRGTEITVMFHGYSAKCINDRCINGIESFFGLDLKGRNPIILIMMSQLFNPSILLIKEKGGFAHKLSGEYILN